ncbi:MAG TPA: hypothetical protein VGR59_09765, partial [Gemmatimonadaceae bacterium]|nr:hypothetical protein [Gemmatimonadaceae bacterium]
KAEAAMAKTMGRSFYTIVRPVEVLQQLIDADPYAAFRIAPNAKRVVTFSRTAHGGGLTLPIEVDGARILAVVGREVFTAYVPGASTPVFMALIEKHFGATVTTRTWDTVGRCVKAAAAGR